MLLRLADCAASPDPAQSLLLGALAQEQVRLMAGYSVSGTP